MEQKTAEVMRLALANGALLSVPVWEDRERASNWAAVIDIDATKPGGLSRQWLPRGRGVCHYMVEQVSLFDVIEFAGDRMTLSGSKNMNRWFGIVISKTDSELVLQRCKDAANAILLARAKRTDGCAIAAALEEQRKAHLKQAEDLGNAIASITASSKEGG